MFSHKKKILAVLVVVLIATVVYAGVDIGIYTENVGTYGRKMHVGNTGNSAPGEIQINATGTLDVDGTFTAVDFTATGAIQGATITATGALVGASLDVNGDADVSGTLNADTLDIDGAADFASTVNITGALTAVDVSSTGTLDADTLDVDGTSNFAGTMTVAGACNITGTATVNGGTLDQDTIIYGNTTVQLVHINGGDLRVGILNPTPNTELDVTGDVTCTGADINGNADVSGTLNADTLDLDGAADFASTVAIAGAVTINGLTVDVDTTIYGNSTSPMIHVDGLLEAVGIGTLTPTTILDVDGTVTATGADVNGDADVSGTLNGDTLDIDGPTDLAGTLSIGSTVSTDAGSGHLVMGRKVDVKHTLDDGTTVVDASTVVYTLPDTGGAVEVICGGTSSGTTDAYSLIFYAVDTIGGGTETAILTLTTDDGSLGDWHAQAIFATIDGAAMSASGSMEFATGDPAVAGLPVGQQNTTIDLSLYEQVMVSIDLEGTTDAFAVEYCVWKVLY